LVELEKNRSNRSGDVKRDPTMREKKRNKEQVPTLEKQKTGGERKGAGLPYTIPIEIEELEKRAKGETSIIARPKGGGGGQG